MSFAAQVWHVFRKDVVRARWFIAFYLAAAAITTSQGSTVGFGGTVYWFLPVVVWLGAMIALAVVVQDDSPIRADAFWASTPQRGLEVVMAKLLFGTLVLGLPPLILELVNLAALDVAIPDALQQLGLGAAGLATFLLIALMLAARTRDLRSFALAVVALPFFFYVLAWAFSTSQPGTLVQVSVGRPEGSNSQWWPAVAGVVVSATLFWIYRVRDVGRGGWVTVLTSVALLIIGGIQLASPPAREDAALVGSPTADLALTLGDRSSLQRARVDVGAATTRADRVARRHVTITRMELKTPDNHGEPLPAVSPMFLAARALVSLPSKPQWINEETFYVRYGTFIVPPHLHAAIARGTAEVVASGEVTESIEREVLRVPAIAGQSATRGGVHIEILRVGATDTSVIDAELIHTPGSYVDAGEGSRFGYVLHNAGRCEAMQLEASAGTESWLGTLPGTKRARTRASFRSPLIINREQQSPAGYTPDADWLRESELIVVEWVPHARYSVTMRERLPAVVIPQQPPVENTTGHRSSR